VPDYCIAEVSDHAVAMTLSLLRKLPLSTRLKTAFGDTPGRSAAR